jgi:protease YdgD
MPWPFRMPAPPAPPRAARRLVFALALATAVPAAAEAPSARISLGEAERAAWAAVGQLQIGRGGRCTATLIAPDVLLTAAHCLFAPETGRAVAAMRLSFRPGWWEGPGRLILSGQAVAVGAGYRHDGPRGSPQGDIALVRLSAAAPAGLVPFPAAKEPAREGERVAVLSFGGNAPDGPAIEPGCRILRRSGALLLTDCEALPGVSGAPLLRLRGGEAEVVGVVSSRLGPETATRGPAVAVAVDPYLAPLTRTLAPRR